MNRRRGNGDRSGKRYGVLGLESFSGGRKGKKIKKGGERNWEKRLLR